MNTYVIGEINAIKSLIKNLPLSLLDLFKGKTYTNMLDFILDVLYACGIDVEKELNELLCKWFKVDGGYVLDPDNLYKKLAQSNIKVESKFLQSLEDAVKVVLIESFITLYSCSAIPEIKNEYMDNVYYKKHGKAKASENKTYTIDDDNNLSISDGSVNSETSNSSNSKKKSVTKKKITTKTGGIEYYKDGLNAESGYISIPLNAIDQYDKLSTSPLSPYGICIYDSFDDSECTYSAERAYSLFEVTFNKNTDLNEYFLDETEATDYLNTTSSALQASGDDDTGTLTKKIKGTVTTGHETYAKALEAAGYVSLSKEKTSSSSSSDGEEVSDNSSQVNKDKLKLYKFLKKSNPSYVMRSFYGQFIKMQTPLQANELYKSNDLDTFIWYAINRGNIYNQYDKNKMVWDNRRNKDARTEDVDSSSENYGQSWDYWLNSKKGGNDFLYQEVDEDEYQFEKGNTREIAKSKEQLYRYRTKGIHPIMQIYKDPTYASENRLAVQISAQRYYRGSGALIANAPGYLPIIRVNHTMYKFNYDYMTSIKIFSAKAILAGMINELMNGSLYDAMGFAYNYEIAQYEAVLSSVIKEALESDDMSINDCFYTFSNDDYDNMLYQEELNRFNGVKTNTATNKVVKADIDNIVNSLNEANSSSTQHDKVTTITKTINSVTATPVGEQLVGGDASFDIGSGTQILYKLIMAFIRPIIACLLAPKVMLIFVINFYVAGLIDFDDLSNMARIKELISKRITAILKSIVKLVIDKIIEELLEIYYKNIQPLLDAFIAYALIEQLQHYLKLLKEATQCIPMFKFPKYNSAIDYVNYADIVNTQSTPETSTTC